MKNIIFICLMWLTVSCQRGNSPEQKVAFTFKKEYQIKLAAHRGNSGLAPENTLATFRKALALGVDYIEIDVRTSKDSQLVILHDSTLPRTTNGTGSISEFTLAEIKQFRANKGWETAFPEETIPTLEETLQLVSNWNKRRNTKTYLYVDCKQVSPKPLLYLMKKYNLDKNSVYYGNDIFLKNLKNEDANTKRMPSLSDEKDLMAKILMLEPYAFDVNWLKINAAFVKSIQDQNIKVFCDLLGPLDRKEHYQKAKEWGIDLLQTDHVKAVYDYFVPKSRNNHAKLDW